MFSLRRPSTREVERFIEASRELALSYDPIGLALQSPRGFRVDESAAVVGSGSTAFVRATTALIEWRHFDLGWVEMFPKQAPIAPGTVVAVLVRAAGLWSLNACRVVYSVDSPGEDAFGFAYGTLTDHVESGEEIFKVTYQPETGDVSYVIRAVSRPRAVAARLGYPLTRALQARFRRDSTRAMARAVTVEQT
jgi:uncharacterized protein (UPF0548 family)